MIEIVEASEPERMPVVRELFLEYAKWLGFDLCFQGFQEELETLPGKYAPPEGRILLALDSPDPLKGQAHAAVLEPAGVVALRPLGEGVCEMKRFWVRPPYRGKGLGRELGTRIVEAARQIGYSEMVLDTLPQMEAARKVYLSLGFEVCEPYYHNPRDEVVYMRKAL